jgi:hypothetical protein
MKIKITDQQLYNDKRVEAEFIGGTLSIIWEEDDSVMSREEWGELNPSEYEQEFGFTLTNNN